MSECCRCKKDIGDPVCCDCEEEIIAEAFEAARKRSLVETAPMTAKLVMSQEQRDALTQSIAERVCEVLAREVGKAIHLPGEEITVPYGGIYTSGYDSGLRRSLTSITRPRDWAAALASEQREKELEEKK